jgi:biotin transport system substrate-specific component
MTADTPASVTNRQRRGTSTTDIALIAIFGALIAVCAVSAALPIGVNGVPVTLQLFAVFLAGAVLGPWRGFLAVLLYVVAGAAGLPIFAGGAAGLAPFSGPTGGYLLAFPFAALLTGLAVSSVRSRRGPVALPVAIVVGGLLGEALTWIVGGTGIALYADAPWWTTVRAAFAYVPADLVKLAAATVVAVAVHRAFPALSGRR